MYARIGLDAPSAKRRNSLLLRVYGISLDEYVAILEYQKWRCPVCDREYEPKKKWALDHEHLDRTTGPVRGIICYTCNRYKVGKLTELEARRIYRYLKDPPAIEALGEVRIATTPKRHRSKRRNASVSRTTRRARKSK